MGNAGKKVKAHYVGTLDDGSQFDSSRDRGEPIAFTCMTGQMIPGFDAAVAEMQVGEVRTVRIPAADAYGEHDESKVIRFQLDPHANLGLPPAIPGLARLQVGQHPVLTSRDGRQVPCVVVAKDDDTITLDMNHELAGKALTFEIELVEVA